MTEHNLFLIHINNTKKHLNYIDIQLHTVTINTWREIKNWSWLIKFTIKYKKLYLHEINTKVLYRIE